MRQQRALAENVVSCKVGCVGESVAKGSKKVNLPFYLAIVRPHLQYYVHVWVFSTLGHRHSGVSLAEAYKMAQGLRHRMYLEDAGTAESVQAEEEKTHGRTYCCLQLPDWKTHHRVRLFSEVHSSRMKGTGHKSQHWKLQ